jgi:hypothetical protein
MAADGSTHLRAVAGGFGFLPIHSHMGGAEPVMAFLRLSGIIAEVPCAAGGP